MAFDSTAGVAFARPGGESFVPSRSRPIDLVHLARQTLGDRVLEQEVLQLFLSQLRTLSDQLGKALPAERQRLAHSLKGSARSVGAFAIATCAERIEAEPADRSLLKQLGRLIEDARSFVAAINR